MPSAAANADDAELQKEYDQLVQAAQIQNAISLNDFLKVEFEERLNQEEMTDEKILHLVQEVKEDIEQEEAENVVDAIRAMIQRAQALNNCCGRLRRPIL